MTNNRSASPTVSVIVRAAATSRDLAGTLSSVRDQTFSDLEVIVVRDGQHGHGNAGAARNAGIANARGCYIAFLEADDFWAVNCLEKQVAYLEAHPWCDVVSADANLSGDPRLAGQRFSRQWASPAPVTLVALIEQRCA